MPLWLNGSHSSREDPLPSYLAGILLSLNLNVDVTCNCGPQNIWYLVIQADIQLKLKGQIPSLSVWRLSLAHEYMCVCVCFVAARWRWVALFWLFFAIYMLLHVTACVCVCMRVHSDFLFFFFFNLRPTIYRPLIHRYIYRYTHHPHTQSRHWPRQNQTRLHTNYSTCLKLDIISVNRSTMETVMEGQVRVVCVRVSVWFLLLLHVRGLFICFKCMQNLPCTFTVP